MRRKISEKWLFAILGVFLGAVVAWAEFSTAVGNGYGVLLDDRDRCVIAWANTSLPSNVVCQEGALLWRSDANTFYTMTSGTWTATTISAGSIARAALAEDALQAHPVTLRSSTGASLLGAETAGSFNNNVSTNVLLLKGEVTDNETETSVGYFDFILPPSYVAAGDVRVSIASQLLKSGSPTNNGSTIDLECFEQSFTAQTVGSDIVATAASTWAALDTIETDTFVITATDLVAGDIVSCKLTTSVVDSEAGAGTITWTASPIKLLLDIKG